jgi:hypothetical protein
MWIETRDGSAINTDYVLRFRTKDGYIVADVLGLPSCETIAKEKQISIEELVNMINGGYNTYVD